MKSARCLIDSTCFLRTTWCLRWVVFLQSIGIGGRYLWGPREAETPLFGMLLFELGAPESTAKLLDDTLVLAYVGAGMAVLILPMVKSVSAWQRPMLVYIFLAHFTFAVCGTYRGGELFSDFTLGALAVRYLGPLGLLLMLPRAAEVAVDYRRMDNAIMLLRIALALTFVIHGIEALFRVPNFVDLIIGSGQLIGLSISQGFAEAILPIIGIIDIVVAVLILCTRRLSVAGYMVCWGLITAFSRITSGGWAEYAEVLVRAAHGGVPLAICIYWSYAKKIRTIPDTTQPDTGAPHAEDDS